MVRLCMTTRDSKYADGVIDPAIETEQERVFLLLAYFRLTGAGVWLLLCLYFGLYLRLPGFLAQFPWVVCYLGMAGLVLVVTRRVPQGIFRGGVLAASETCGRLRVVFVRITLIPYSCTHSHPGSR